MWTQKLRPLSMELPTPCRKHKDTKEKSFSLIFANLFMILYSHKGQLLHAQPILLMVQSHIWILSDPPALLLHHLCPQLKETKLTQLEPNTWDVWWRRILVYSSLHWAVTSTKMFSCNFVAEWFQTVCWWKKIFTGYLLIFVVTALGLSHHAEGPGHMHTHLSRVCGLL